MGNGINIGNCLDAPYEGAWGVVLEEEDFEYAADWGFDHIRLPVRWNPHSSTSAPYTIEADFFDRVDWAIEQATSRGLRVVLDVHHFDELNADPPAFKEQFFGIWAQIAKHYRDYGPELYFELLNEPLEGFSAKEWNEWVAELVPLIRTTNPWRSIVVGGINMNHIVGLEELVLPDDDHLIATFHFYEPVTFVYQGAGSWVPGSENWVGTKWYGSDSEVKAIDDEFARVEAWQAANGDVPLYLGEWGTTNVGDMESRVRYTAFIVESCAERDYSHAIWDMHSELGIHIEATDTVQTELVDAVMDPSKTFAATRTTPPQVKPPDGPSVLVDDFEDGYGDRADQSHIAAAWSAATENALELPSWFALGSEDSSITGLDDEPLVTWEQYSADGTETNFGSAVGDIGHEGHGVEVHYSLGTSADTYIGFGVALTEDFDHSFVDFSDLSAVSLWARGSGTVDVELTTNDVLNGYPEADNWGHFSRTIILTEEWMQHVILVEDLRPRDWSPAAADGLAWADARDEVSGILFLATTSGEFFLDDVRLHGIDYDAWGFEYAAP